ncbi:MAG: branched-chain amino acid ABC transporter permease [Candidatus Bathyarchaeia archaeon]
MFNFSLFLYGFIIAGIYALIALGFNLAVGTLKVLNVAHGDFVMIGAYITYWLFTLYGIDPLLSSLFSSCILFVLGVLISKFIIVPLNSRCEDIEQLLSSSVLIFFGLSILLQNIAFLLWSANYRGYTYLDTPIILFGISVASIRLIVAVVAYLATTLFHLFLLKTRVGMSVRAVSQNKERALLIGINVDRLYLIVLGISAALAGMAGSLISAIYAIYPAIGGAYLIRGMCIAALGGLGNMKGAIFSSIILGLSESFVVFYIGSGLQDLIAYSLLVLILLLKPSGIFAR